MESKEILTKSLEESQRYLDQALEGLTPEEIAWASNDDCNSIAFILWHMTRAEDMWISRVILEEAEVHEAGGWDAKLGTPAKESGYGYTREQLRSWPVPELEPLREYAGAVRDKTNVLIEATTEEELSREAGTSPLTFLNTVGAILAHVITEIALHVGQIAYLRGAQRGLEPPPERRNT